MAKHTKGAPRAKKPRKTTTRTKKSPSFKRPPGQNDNTRLNGFSLFMSQMAGTAWPVPPGTNRLTQAAALWQALPKAAQDVFKERAKDIRKAALKKPQEHAQEDGVPEDGGANAGAQTVAGVDVAADDDAACMISGSSLLDQPAAPHGSPVLSPSPNWGPLMLSPPATPVDGSGLEAHRTDPMWRPHSSHPSTTPSAYSAADGTFDHHARAPLPSYRDGLTKWRLPSYNAAGGHANSAMPPVASSGSGLSSFPWSMNQDMYVPPLNATNSPARDSDRSLPESSPAIPAHSSMPGIDPLLAVPVGYQSWTPPPTPSTPDDVNWPAIQFVDSSDEPHYAPGQALPGAAPSSVNFWNGDPHGGAAQALAFSPTPDAQLGRLAAAEEWAAFLDGLQGGDGNSGIGQVAMSSAPDMPRPCSPASQAVIELLTDSLGHGGAASFQPTPSPSASSPVEETSGAFYEGSSGRQFADTPPRKYWEDAPWTPSALLAFLDEEKQHPSQTAAFGGDYAVAIAPFMTMLLEAASPAERAVFATQ